METVLRDLEYFATLAAFKDPKFKYPKYVPPLHIFLDFDTFIELAQGNGTDDQGRPRRDVARYNARSIP